MRQVWCNFNEIRNQFEVRYSWKNAWPKCAAVEYLERANDFNNIIKREVETTKDRGTVAGVRMICGVHAGFQLGKLDNYREEA